MIRFLSLCLFCIPAFADVYKCEIEGKVTFSGRPCAEDAEKVEVKDTGGLQSDNPLLERQGGLTERVLHNQSIDLEIQQVRRSAAVRIADYRRQRDQCERNTYRAANNAAGALWEQALRDCINGFEERIQEEELRRDDTIRELRRDKQTP